MSRRRAHVRGRRPAVLGCAAILTLAIAMPDDSPTIGPDWCWRYYSSAPAAALATDLGPPTADHADEWIAWLEATADAPTGHRQAHADQLDLVRQLQSSGAWNADQARRYAEAAASDPTPATTCERFGARIIPNADGSLADGWDARFTDPNDPAYSRSASENAST